MNLLALREIMASTDYPTYDDQNGRGGVYKFYSEDWETCMRFDRKETVADVIRKLIIDAENKGYQKGVIDTQSAVRKALGIPHTFI